MIVMISSQSNNLRELDISNSINISNLTNIVLYMLSTQNIVWQYKYIDDILSINK